MSEVTEQDMLEADRHECRSTLFLAAEQELERAYAKHGDRLWTRHEFYAVLLEEVEELWAEIKANAKPERVHEEMVQVIAVCMRFNEQ